MTRMTVVTVGFDPGTTGAAAIIGLPGGPQVFDLPTVLEDGDGTTKRRLHGPALYQLLMSRLAGATGVHVVKERLAYGGTRQGGFNMVQTTVSQASSHECIRTTVELMGLTLEQVSPQKWKALYGLGGKGSDKKAATDDARAMALRLYPDLQQDLRLAKFHNRADAVLIAHFFRRELLRRNEISSKEDPFA